MDSVRKLSEPSPGKDKNDTRVLIRHINGPWSFNNA
jgi:hypothetical protein